MTPVPGKYKIDHKNYKPVRTKWILKRIQGDSCILLRLFMTSVAAHAGLVGHCLFKEGNLA
jgi:hypothetical protein